MSHDPLVVSLKPQPKPESRPEPERPANLPPPPVNPPRRRKRNPLVSVVVLVLIVLLIAGGWYAYKRWSTRETITDTSIPAQTEDVAALIARVGELIVLPEGEEPTIATVTDPEKLKDQVFFANAKVGDKVLVYTKARKAYLYDPKADKLVEVAPLTVENQ